MDSAGSLQFTPLCGAQTEDPLCYLLEIDDVKFLLDCGWNEQFDVSVLEPLREIATEIDYILISFPDLEHMGALPYAMKEFGMTALVYTTIPNANLGQMYLYDAYLNRAAQGKFDLFDLDDIDETFKKVIPMEAGQKLRLEIQETNVEIEIEPIKAGRIVGGAMWRIRRDPEVILYAVDYNHSSDELLAGAVFPTGIEKPTLLITDAFNFLQNDTQKRKDKINSLQDQVLFTLRQGGSVLLPVDSCGRVLELLVILNRFWSAKKVTYPLIFLSRVSSVVDVASQNLSWMKQQITDEFDKTRINPFERDRLNHVKVLDDLEQVNAISGPKVVIASSGTIECGMARDLFVEWSTMALNRVIITDRGMINESLVRKLLKKPVHIDITLSQWVQLEGTELEQWHLRKAEQSQIEARRRMQMEEEKALQEMTGNTLEELDDGEDDDALHLEVGLEDNLDEKENSKANKNFSLLRQNSVEGASSAQSRKRLFTVSDPERNFRWGEYGEETEWFKTVHGEVIAAGGLSVAQATPSDQEGLKPKSGDESKRSGESKENRIGNKPKTKLEELVLQGSSKGKELVDEIPRKCEVTKDRLALRCDIDFIDMSGRPNSTSIRRLIQSMEPKKIIVVHGTKQASESMVQFCKEKQTIYGAGSQTLAKAPGIKECLDITSDTNVFRLKLSKDFFDENTPTSTHTSGTGVALRLNRVGPYEVAYVDGLVDTEAELPGSKKRPRLPILEPLSATTLSTARDEPVPKRFSPQFLRFGGGVRLLELKNLLTSKGYKTDYVEGKYLVCNEEVTVFLPNTGQVEIGGPLSDDYFSIRSLVYSQFIMV